MDSLNKKIRIHRFGDNVAIRFGTGRTIYINQTDVCLLTQLLESFRQDIQSRPFYQSTIGTKIIENGEISNE